MDKKKVDPSKIESTTLSYTKDNSRINKRGKEKGKFKKTSISQIKDTNLKTGGTFTINTTSIDKKGKRKSVSKFKRKTEKRDKDGKLITKSTKKITSRNGKTKINREKFKRTKNYRSS